MNGDFTRNLDEFGWFERQQLIEILTVWQDSGLPPDFELGEIQACFDKETGNTYLTNNLAQYCCKTDENKLECWHECECCGYEGFNSELQLTEYGCIDCMSQGELA